MTRFGASLTRAGANLTRYGAANQLSASLLGGQLGVQSAMNQASLLRFGGSGARRAGYVGAGSALLSGIGTGASLYGQSYRYGQPARGGWNTGEIAWG